MSALGQGDIVTQLVVIGLIAPRPVGDFEFRAGGTVQVDVRDAVEIVGSGEQSRIRRVVAAGERQAAQSRAWKWNNVDAVPVVVERDFVEQRGTDGIRRVDDRAVRRIGKGIAHGRNVRTAPLTDGETLRDLLCNEMAEYRELAAEGMVDTSDFFLQVRRSVRRAQELAPRRGRGENTR